MRWVLSLVALATVAVGLALLARYNTGYVLITFAPYRLEFSLNLLIVVVLLACLGFYAAVRLAKATLGLPRKVRAWRENRAKSRARKTMHEALTAYFEGRYSAAEKAAAKAFALDEWPALSSILAARSAHQLRRFAERDGYLKLADQSGGSARLLRPLTEAELLLRESRASEALQALAEANKAAPKSVAVLRLTLKAQTLVKNWPEVLQLTDRLEKVKGIDPAYAVEVRRNAWVGLLNRNAQEPQALIAAWQSIPAALRKQRAIALTAAKYFIAQGGVKEATEIIEASLALEWDSALICLYGDCYSQNVVRQIERAEDWLKEHREDAMLLLTLGKLCARQSLWGKARSYIEASLAVQPTQAAHIALAQLLESLGQRDEALLLYRDSLTLDRRDWAIGDEPKAYAPVFSRAPLDNVNKPVISSLPPFDEEETLHLPSLEEGEGMLRLPPLKKED